MPATEQPRRRIDGARLRGLLLQAREDVAVALSRSFETQQELHQAMGITEAVWRECFPDEECPAFEMQPRMVRDAA